VRSITEHEPSATPAWVTFDVVARDAAHGAHAAMRLREQLPAAMIYSAPDRSPSDDPTRPHLLHCHACAAGTSMAQLATVIAAAAANLDPDRVRLVLLEQATARAA